VDVRPLGRVRPRERGLHDLTAPAGRRSPERRPAFRFVRATQADLRDVVTVRDAAAADLTAKHGIGHWSGLASQRSLELVLRQSYILLARRGRKALGTLRLATRKPWAIDVRCFTPVRKPIYLLDMAVHPLAQREGLGRELLERAAVVARAWPGDAIRLDAYDAPAGAGGFYAACGYTEVGRVVFRTLPLIYYELLL
jgi:GNAT superfamily N-acetyltransferase